MAISKKPKAQPASPNDETQSEESAMNFINKGMSAPQEEPEQEQDKPKRLQLRLMPECIRVIDGLRNRHAFARVSRHAWIVEAIEEKINREKEHSS